MRRSEFHRAVDAEFHGRGDSLVEDLVLSTLSQTAAQALEAGVPPREIWLALCAETDVPLERRYGAGRLTPRRR